MKTFLWILAWIVGLCIVLRIYRSIGYIVADSINLLCKYADMEPLDEDAYSTALFVWPICVITVILYLLYALLCKIKEFLFH